MTVQPTTSWLLVLGRLLGTPHASSRCFKATRAGGDRVSDRCRAESTTTINGWVGAANWAGLLQLQMCFSVWALFCRFPACACYERAH